MLIKNVPSKFVRGSPTPRNLLLLLLLRLLLLPLLLLFLIPLLLLLLRLVTPKCGLPLVNLLANPTAASGFARQPSRLSSKELRVFASSCHHIATTIRQSEPLSPRP